MGTTDPQPKATLVSPVDEKKVHEHVAEPVAPHSSVDSLSNDVQGGVREADAITRLWTRKHLVAAYILIWVVNFMHAFNYGITSTLTPYVTSAFQGHSLTATTSIVSSLVGGIVKLPFAKLLDIWGRTQCFGLGIVVLTVGLIMMAACQNVTTYAAAQVFYTVGYNMISFVMNIFIVDTSSLRNRGLMFAYSATPYLATTWAFGPATDSILSTIGFRWGFGIWAILYPVFCSPLLSLFWYYHIQAKNAEMISKKTNRTWREGILYYGREFDVIGLLVLSAGLAMFLLSFSLYSYQPQQWRSPLIICLVVLGGLLIIAFGLWEKYLAPVCFVPWYLLRNRTVAFTFVMAIGLYTAWYIWDSYFYSFLIVVFDLSIRDATYITNTYTIGSTFWAVIAGIVFRYWGRLKWHAVLFGAPLTLLGNALMIPFRSPGSPIGMIVLCQIFIAFGGGTLVLAEQLTVQAVSDRKDIPALLATEGMVVLIGSSIGSTIAAAMWTGIFPARLAKNLPASAQGQLAQIYGDIEVQSGYPVGSSTRDAINRSYGETQRLMLITSTCVNIITCLAPLFWQDVDVRKLDQQVSGVVV